MVATDGKGQVQPGQPQAEMGGNGGNSNIGSMIVVGLPAVGVPLFYRNAKGPSRRDRVVGEKDVPASEIDVPCEGFAPSQVLGELELTTPWGAKLIGNDGAAQFTLDFATTGIDPRDPDIARRLAMAWKVRSTRTGLTADWSPTVASRDVEMKLIQVASAQKTGTPPELSVVKLDADGGFAGRRAAQHDPTHARVYAGTGPRREERRRPCGCLLVRRDGVLRGGGTASVRRLVGRGGVVDGADRHGAAVAIGAPDVPLELDAAIRRCLAKQRAHRPATVAEAWQGIRGELVRAHLSSQPIPPNPEHAGVQTPPPMDVVTHPVREIASPVSEVNYGQGVSSGPGASTIGMPSRTYVARKQPYWCLTPSSCR